MLLLFSLAAVHLATTGTLHADQPAPWASVSRSDEQFIRQAEMGGVAEVEMARLAKKQGVTLRMAIEHHVRDEEGEIFPEMERSLDGARLETLGLEIENAKQSAPERPPESSAEASPGTSLTGTVSAATDRLTK
jgi:hypothetical protein